MKRLTTVLILAVLFSIIAIYIIYPESIEKLWLWFIRLIGVIITFIQKSGDWIEDQIKRISKKETPENENVGNVFMQIFRYSRSGNRFFGLVYIGETFVGISNENTTITPAIYELDIRENQIVFFKDDVSAKLVKPLQQGTIANDFVIASDLNTSIPKTANEMVYNSVFEMLADWIEQGKKAKLKIYDIESTTNHKNPS